jgi:DNA gyrase subunit A
MALIRNSATVDDARDGLIKLLKIDELQARAILNMQIRQLAGHERQKIIEAVNSQVPKGTPENQLGKT